MDRARLSASGRARLSSGQARVLQPRGSLGRRAADRLGSRRDHAVILMWRLLIQAPLRHFGDPDGAGLATLPAGLTPVSSTSKINFELGGISGPTARSP